MYGDESSKKVDKDNIQVSSIFPQSIWYLIWDRFFITLPPSGYVQISFL